MAVGLPTGPRALVRPAVVWPADHPWIFTSDVDPHWAGIGASREAIKERLDDPVLDIVAADAQRSSALLLGRTR